MTWRMRLASYAWPGSRVTGVDTCPGLTQIMFGCSSSPKSLSSFAFWSQGFQMIVSGRLYFCILIFRPDTTLVTMCSWGSGVLM